MQATVLDFDADHQTGRVVLDDGTARDFGADAFAAGGLRLLRPGQRVRIDVGDDQQIRSIIVSTLPDPLA